MTTYLLNILEGLVVTLGVALGALVVAATLGLAGAAAKLSPYKTLNWVGDIYSTVIRGVPDLVWMLLLYSADKSWSMTSRKPSVSGAVPRSTRLWPVCSRSVLCMART